MTLEVTETSFAISLN